MSRTGQDEGTGPERTEGSTEHSAAAEQPQDAGGRSPAAGPDFDAIQQRLRELSQVLASSSGPTDVRPPAFTPAAPPVEPAPAPAAQEPAPAPAVAAAPVEVAPAPAVAAAPVEPHVEAPEAPEAPEAAVAPEAPVAPETPTAPVVVPVPPVVRVARTSPVVTVRTPRVGWDLIGLAAAWAGFIALIGGLVIRATS
jgi:uncharacterized membrane protein